MIFLLQKTEMMKGKSYPARYNFLFRHPRSTSCRIFRFERIPPVFYGLFLIFLFFFLSLSRNDSNIFPPSSHVTSRSRYFCIANFFLPRPVRGNAQEWSGERGTNLPIYVSGKGVGVFACVSRSGRVMLSVAGNGVVLRYNRWINWEEKASRFLSRCSSSFLLMPLRGNYYFPLVYIVWEFHRRSFAFVSRRFEKFSPLLKGRGRGWDSFTVAS